MIQHFALDSPSSLAELWDSAQGVSCLPSEKCVEGENVFFLTDISMISTTGIYLNVGLFLLLALWRGSWVFGKK
jgi:hypothetical protein